MNEMVKIQHQQWARDLDDQRRSGLTQREWCRIHGISEYSCAVKPPFRDAGYRRSRDGVPQIV